MNMSERRIEAAKKRERNAQEALHRAYEAKRAAIKTVSAKKNPAIWKADRMCREARGAVTLAEMAAHGIEPMKTIIRCKPMMSKRWARFVVAIDSSGYARLLEVGVKCTILKNRAQQLAPWKWSDATITGDELKETAS